MGSSGNPDFHLPAGNSHHCITANNIFQNHGTGIMCLSGATNCQVVPPECLLLAQLSAGFQASPAIV